MKLNVIITLSALCMAGAINAQENNSIEENHSERTLSCTAPLIYFSPIDFVLGIKYGIIIEGNNSSSGYEASKAYFTMSKIHSNQISDKRELKLLNQNPSNAIFDFLTGMSEYIRANMSVYALLDKNDFTVQIKRGSSVIFSCAEKN